jgi:HK97 family phage portal protein
MGFLSNLTSRISNLFIGQEEQYNEAIANIIAGSAPRYSADRAGNIATVHTCVKILAETMGRLPLGVMIEDPAKGKLKDKDHYLYDLLHYNPNPWTTSQVFISTLETIRNYKGNSYAYIHRSNGEVGRPEMFTLIDPSRVVGHVIQNNQLFYRITDKDDREKIETVNSQNVLHFKHVSRDGIYGINPIEALRLNLSTTWEGLNTINEFYVNNGVNPKALKSTVSGANQKAIMEALDTLKKQMRGSKNAGEIIPLPPNTEIQELSMNAIDAVFLTMIESNARQISALYGLNPVMTGDTSSSKYNSIEASQIALKVNTISSIARMYRQEFEYKCLTTDDRRKNGNSIEFNLMALVETDHRTRLEGYRILSNIGAITPNKVAILEGLETYPGGDDHYIQTNMMSVEQYNANKKKQQKQGNE